RLPKKADGTSFPTPSFNAAPYDVFNPSSSVTVDLATAFKTYDDATLRKAPIPLARYNYDPQSAYYYVYTGPELLHYASAPCTVLDAAAPGDPSHVQGTSGGGTWTRVTVPAAERQNFANWYTYYRTRINLTKSAASLAFTPLSDSFRVGFITAEPKDL